MPLELGSRGVFCVVGGVEGVCLGCLGNGDVEDGVVPREFRGVGKRELKESPVPREV